MVERVGVCVPVASPQRERKQCCCFSGRGRRESTDVLKEAACQGWQTMLRF